MYKSTINPLLLLRHVPRGLCFRAHSRTLSHFRTIEHLVPTQHTRHWLGATELGHEHALKLAVKQYIPRDQEASRPGDVTLIASHANAFPKEMYEPLFDDLYVRMRAAGQRIRSIWIADAAHQGMSAVVNEASLGDDPSWWDHARDLLFLINQKQGEMPQPLMGIGHSMGASQLVHLSLLHPRLLQSLVLIDPVIQITNPGKAFASASTYRRDLWPSRTDAEARFRASKFYQSWNPRVFEKWMEFGLRECPTEIYLDEGKDGDGKEKPVTLTTPKVQELLSYLRPTYRGTDGIPASKDVDVYGDMHPDDVEAEYPFYRPEAPWLFRRLPEVKPSVLYVFGSQSALSIPEAREAKVSTTGTGVGGSGGAGRGRVIEALLDCGHLVAFEKPEETAAEVAEFIEVELKRWRHDKRVFERKWREKPRIERVTVDEEWKQKIGARKPKESSGQEKDAAKSGNPSS